MHVSNVFALPSRHTYYFLSASPSPGSFTFPRSPRRWNKNAINKNNWSKVNLIHSNSWLLKCPHHSRVRTTESDAVCLSNRMKKNENQIFYIFECRAPFRFLFFCNLFARRARMHASMSHASEEQKEDEREGEEKMSERNGSWQVIAVLLIVYGRCVALAHWHVSISIKLIRCIRCCWWCCRLSSSLSSCRTYTLFDRFRDISFHFSRIFFVVFWRCDDKYNFNDMFMSPL